MNGMFWGIYIYYLVIHDPLPTLRNAGKGVIVVIAIVFGVAAVLPPMIVAVAVAVAAAVDGNDDPATVCIFFITALQSVENPSTCFGIVLLVIEASKLGITSRIAVPSFKSI